MKTELVTTLKRQATKLLKELKEEKEPVLITEHGKPSAYLVDVDHFEQIQKKLKLLEGLARGEKAILEDRVVSYAMPKSGKLFDEFEVSVFREIVLPPCKIFYRIDDDIMNIIHMIREEQFLHIEILKSR